MSSSSSRVAAVVTVFVAAVGVGVWRFAADDAASPAVETSPAPAAPAGDPLPESGESAPQPSAPAAANAPPRSAPGPTVPAPAATASDPGRNPAPRPADAPNAADRVADAPSIDDEETEPVPALPGLDGLNVPPRRIYTQTALELAAEPEDPFWAPDMEARLLGDIAGVTGLRASLLHVDCRSTMCGVVIVHPDGVEPALPGAVLPDLDAMAGPHGLEVRITFTYGAQNSPLITAYYLHRDGTSRPRSVAAASAAT